MVGPPDVCQRVWGVSDNIQSAALAVALKQILDKEVETLQQPSQLPLLSPEGPSLLHKDTLTHMSAKWCEDAGNSAIVASDSLESAFSARGQGPSDICNLKELNAVLSL